MNVIENARKGAAERSIENYVRAVDTAIMAEKLNGIVSDGVYTVTSTGDLCLGEETTCAKPLEVGVNGDAPKEGSKIAIENNKIVQVLSTESSQKTTVSIGDYTVEYNGEGKLEASKGILKKFMINDMSLGELNSFSFEKGMTWGDFIDSSYNVGNFVATSCSDEYGNDGVDCISTSSGSLYDWDNYKFYNSSDLIDEKTYDLFV